MSEEYTVEEGYCEKREDETHCVCWWEGEACCSCGHTGEVTDEMDTA